MIILYLTKVCGHPMLGYGIWTDHVGLKSMVISCWTIIILYLTMLDYGLWDFMLNYGLWFSYVVI